MTPVQDERFDQKVADINGLCQQAPELAHQGECVVSTGELTGVQAVERKHEGLPMQPGKVVRREFEDIRNGTQSFILSFDVAVGEIMAANGGDTQNEADFANHIRRILKTRPKVKNGISSPIISISTFPKHWCAMLPKSLIRLWI